MYISLTSAKNNIFLLQIFNWGFCKRLFLIEMFLDTCFSGKKNYFICTFTLLRLRIEIHVHRGIQKVSSSRREGRRVLKKRTKTSRGRGSQAYTYVRSVKKITWFFKQQTEFFLIVACQLLKVLSFWPAYKSNFLLKRHIHFFSFLM